MAFPRLIGFLLLFVTIAAAQDRGSIGGTVADQSGSAIAGARVIALNTATGVATISETNESGIYALLYLIPGSYTLTVEHPGFQKLTRPGVEVRVADELSLDLKLSVGSVKETIVVRESTPMIQARDADLGATMNQQQLADLPLEDGNPFILARLAAGVVFTGSPQFARPFDNGDTSAIRINGAEGSNEFTLNGMSNTGRQSAGGNAVVAFVPPSDSVQEFKMTTSSFSALQGHTTGSTINVSTKSGTNRVHGTLYEFFRNEKLSANDFFSNRAGQTRPVVRYNRFGGTVGGPVFVPKLYDGRNKTFFFFAYENLPDVFPEPNSFTVPTVAERGGDFSKLPATKIYDPITAVPASGGHVTRTQFPNNMIPSARFSPIALKLLNFYPLPNQPGNADGSSDYYSQQSRTDRFHTALVRVDELLSSRQKLSGSYFANWRLERRFAWAPPVDGYNASGQDLFRINHGVSLNDVITLSPSFLLDVRAGFNRFVSSVVPTTLGYDPAQLGFSPAVTALMLGGPYIPAFDINGYTRLSHNTGNSLYQAIISNTYTLEPVFTKVHRSHTLNFGYNFRLYRENFISLGDSEGYFNFTDDYTRQSDTSSNAQGQGFAAFLLGQPVSGKIDRNDSRANQAPYHAVYFQDDWKVSSKLTLNLGVRYEYEGPTTERYDRNIRGFDLADRNPVANAAITAFAAAFPKGLTPEPGQPTITAANFQVLGGYLFAGPSQRGFWNPSFTNFQPRFGFAYAVAPRTVVRGGWAIYSVPLQISGVNQIGFSQSTSLVPSNDTGLTFVANLANPFPNGVLPQAGSSLGLTTQLGQNVSIFPLDPQTGRSAHWSFDIQRELPGQWIIDAAYVGSRGYNLSRSSNYLDAVPPQYLSTSATRDNTIIGQLTANVANPFLGLAPGSSLNTAKTVQAQQLLRPFPEFPQITTQVYNGSNFQNAGQLRVEHRSSRGYAIVGTYTWSKLLERFGFLNDFQRLPTKQLSGNDVPHRATMTLIGQLPFGAGRRWGSNWRGVTNAAFGGWQVQGIYQVQGGSPIGWGDYYYNGDPSKLRTNINSNTLNQAFDTSGFYFWDAAVVNSQTGQVDPNLQRNDARINLANNVRTFPNNLPGFRGHAQNNVDLSSIKNFFVREGMNLQFRAEFLNAFNHPWFSNPTTSTPRSASFATITSQRNFPRQIQVALKLVF